MKFRRRYVVLETDEGLWAICEGKEHVENVLAWSADRDTAHLIAEALDVLPLTVAAMMDWEQGFRDSPKFTQLKYQLLNLRVARKYSELRFETHSWWKNMRELLKAVLIGLFVLLVLIYALTWLARLF